MKIWRYVDLAKFVSMVATGTLYFPCATTELADPYEGWLPCSHIKAFTELARANSTGGNKCGVRYSPCNPGAIAHGGAG